MIVSEPTAIPSVVVLHPTVLRDDRGFFLESWQERDFARVGIHATFVQDNHSQSKQYTLRGLHFQARHPQGKLVRVVRGTVFDVAVDIRRASSTFGQSVAVILSEENHCMLWIPPGFAHGFFVLSQQADLLYRCTDFWHRDLDRSIAWNDPSLHIDWPVPRGQQPIVSPKDSTAPLLRDAESLL